MDNSKGFVASIGNTNVDILYSGIDRLPNEGEEIYSRDFSLQLGGGAPATMINVGRLGIPSRIATQLGDDMFSVFAKSQFEKNNVSPVNLYEGNSIPLNITSAMITERDRTFITYGAGDVTADDKKLSTAYEMCSGARIVLMQTGSFLPVYEKLKKEGTLLVFDCGWDDELSLEKYERYLDLADYYTPNQKEALKITGAETPSEAAKILSRYFKKTIVKLDKDGCLGLENGKEFIVPNIEEFKRVDTTGAGDAFLAGLIYGLYYGYDFADCILMGNITGGKSVTKVGCLSAYVCESEFKEIYKAYKEKFSV